uniref:Uncharacterized protein n=1 Tax=Noctiluca scintillans TaxID=2966 RepID=A0A7S1F046_NOCSC
MAQARDQGSKHCGSGWVKVMVCVDVVVNSSPPAGTTEHKRMSVKFKLTNPLPKSATDATRKCFSSILIRSDEKIASERRIWAKEMGKQAIHIPGGKCPNALSAECERSKEKRRKHALESMKNSLRIAKTVDNMPTVMDPPVGKIRSGPSSQCETEVEGSSPESHNASDDDDAVNSWTGGWTSTPSVQDLLEPC